MNTARHTHGLLRTALLLALPLAFLAGCGDDARVEDDSVGVRRYGAPKPGSIDWGEEGKAVEIGTADNIASKPAAPKPPPRPRAPSAGSSRKPKAGKYAAIEVEGGGSVKGTIKFTGQPPLRMIEFNKDQKACGHTEHRSERMVFDEKTLTVANCFVYLEDISKGKDWTGEFAKDEDTREAVLDQKGCVYIPHILPIRANTQLRILNSDNAEHNVHIYRGGASGTTQANVLSPAESNQLPPSGYIEKPDVYAVKCDIHSWMNGYVWAMNHPYYAVTGKDGTFEIKDVPPGTYTLVMWHEGMEEKPQVSGGAISGYSYGDPVVDRAQVSVDAGGTVTQDFTIDPPSK